MNALFRMGLGRGPIQDPPILDVFLRFLGIVLLPGSIVVVFIGVGFLLSSLKYKNLRKSSYILISTAIGMYGLSYIITDVLGLN